MSTLYSIFLSIQNKTAFLYKRLVSDEIRHSTDELELSSHSAHRGPILFIDAQTSESYSLC